MGLFLEGEGCLGTCEVVRELSEEGLLMPSLEFLEEEEFSVVEVGFEVHFFDEVLERYRLIQTNLLIKPRSNQTDLQRKLQKLLRPPIATSYHLQHFSDVING